jgi:hypothetical protein
MEFLNSMAVLHWAEMALGIKPFEQVWHGRTLSGGPVADLSFAAQAQAIVERIP